MYWEKNQKKWTTGFINLTVQTAINIWQFCIDNEFGTNKEIRGKKQHLALQPKIEKAYKKNDIGSTPRKTPTNSP